MIVMDSGKTLQAKERIEELCNQGSSITLIKAATQDELGEPTSKTTIDLNAFPIRYAPFNRSFLAKVAWAEEVDVVFYVAKKTQDDLSRTIKDLKKYSRIEIDGKRYGLQRIQEYSKIGDDFLYYLIGGKKS